MHAMSMRGSKPKYTINFVKLRLCGGCENEGRETREANESILQGGEAGISILPKANLIQLMPLRSGGRLGTMMQRRDAGTAFHLSKCSQD